MIMKRRGRPVLGAFGGLLMGVGAAVLLQQFGISSLDAITLYGLPVAGLVIGVALALWAPFGAKS